MSYPEPIVSALIANKKGEILLMRSPKWKGVYVPPGGHIELGETIERALHREIREEVGLKIKNTRLLAVHEGIFPKELKYRRHFIYFHFACDAASDRVKTDGKEVSSYIWVKPRDALKLPLDKKTKASVKLLIGTSALR